MERALSIVLVARNDDYIEDYKYRLNTSLNHLSLVVQRIGALNDVEVLIVDWGSESPLQEVLKLTDSAAQISQILTVSPAQVKRLAPSDMMYMTLPTNIGARRASGRYIMTADTDGLYPDTALEAIVRLSKDSLKLPIPAAKTFFPIHRYQIPHDRVSRQPSVSEWNRALPFLTGEARHEAPGQSALGGFAAALLMHRDMWDRLGGYNEKMTKPWGWTDNELMMRAMIRHGWFDLAHYGIFAFHMEHGPRRNDSYASKISRVNPMLIPVEEKPSGSDWGAVNETIEIIRPTASIPGRSIEVRGRKALSAACSDMRVFERMLWDETDHEVREHLYDRYNLGLSVTEQDREATLVLQGFCRVEHPLNLFYVGNLSPLPLAAIFMRCKTIEATMFGPWPPGDATSEAFTPAGYSILSSICGYQGFGRVIPIVPDQASNQMESIVQQMDPLELVVLDRRTFEDPDDRVLTYLALHLAPGGLLLLINPAENVRSEPDTAGDRISLFFGTTPPNVSPAIDVLESIARHAHRPETSAVTAHKAKSGSQGKTPAATIPNLRAFVTASGLITAVIATRE